MNKSFDRLVEGYRAFRQKYAGGDNSNMRQLADHGQKPEVMIVACCDSRVDPALILQCAPGDLFTIRNVANIIPPCEADKGHHGTSAALEFGVCYLNVKHLIILGHSQCGGIHALLNSDQLEQNDFITQWVSHIPVDANCQTSTDEFAKSALLHSYHNCLTFSWIKERVDNNTLSIHPWFFDIKEEEIFSYSFSEKQYQKLVEVD